MNDSHDVWMFVAGLTQLGAILGAFLGTVLAGVKGFFAGMACGAIAGIITVPAGLAIYFAGSVFVIAVLVIIRSTAVIITMIITWLLKK